MNRTLLAFGTALLLAGIAVSGEAYHVKGNATDLPCNGATTTHDWCMPFGNACEQDDPIATPGIGGLCFMSVGHGAHDDPATVTVDESCTSSDVHGRSDGFGYQSTVGSEAANPACPSGPTAGTFHAFDLYGADGTVAWLARVGSVPCDDDVIGAMGEVLVVDEDFLFWTGNGHVSGFVNGVDTTNTTATWGSYTVSAALAPTTPTCNSSLPSAPMYIV